MNPEPKILHAERLPIRPRMRLDTLDEYSQRPAARQVIQGIHFMLRNGDDGMLKKAVDDLVRYSGNLGPSFCRPAAAVLSRLRKETLSALGNVANAPTDATLFITGEKNTGDLNGAQHALIAFDGKASYQDAQNTGRDLFNTHAVIQSLPQDRASLLRRFEVVEGVLNVSEHDMLKQHEDFMACINLENAKRNRDRAEEEVRRWARAVEDWFSDEWIAQQRKNALDRRNAAHEAFKEACDELTLRLTTAFNGEVDA